jgi:hypothetical protein
MFSKRTIPGFALALADLYLLVIVNFFPKRKLPGFVLALADLFSFCFAPFYFDPRKLVFLL